MIHDNYLSGKKVALMCFTVLSIQHTHLLPMEHTTHAAIIGAKPKHIAITSCQVLISWMGKPVATLQHCSSGASTTQPFGYESYASNCAITARQNLWSIPSQSHLIN